MSSREPSESYSEYGEEFGFCINSKGFTAEVSSRETNFDLGFKKTVLTALNRIVCWGDSGNRIRIGMLLP